MIVTTQRTSKGPKVLRLLGYVSMCTGLPVALLESLSWGLGLIGVGATLYGLGTVLAWWRNA